MYLLPHLKLLAFALLAALVAAYLLTPLAMRLGFRLGLVDQPGGRRIHENPTPRSGGLAVFSAFFCCAALLPLLADSLSPEPAFQEWLRNTFLVALPLLAIGVTDDRWEIRPSIKLAGQTFVAVLAWCWQLRLGTLLGMELLPALDFAATVLLFLAAMNAYNLIDGMDGVAGGLGGITGVGLCGLNLMLGNTLMASAALALTGACLGFLRYNFHPARVFLGDTGSMLIGYLLICMTLGSSARSAAAIMIVVPLLTLGVPLLDSGLAVWRRSIRKLLDPASGAKLSRGDRDHLHHRLARGGLTQRRVAATLYFLQASLFAIGLLWMFFQNHRLAIFTSAFFAGSYVFLRYLASIELNASGKWIVDGIRRPDRKRLFGSLLPMMDLLILGGGLLCFSLLTSRDFPRLRIAFLFKDAAPTLLGGPLILLWAFRYYRPMWTRARAMDYFSVGVLASAGVLLGFSLSSIPYTHSAIATLRLGLLYCSLTVPWMVLIRATPRLVQDLLHHHERRRFRDDQGPIPRALIYGAGYGHTLLTRAESFQPLEQRRAYSVVGLIDDDPRLHGLVLEGHKVLGGIDELPRILQSCGITEIILTTHLLPEREERMLALAEHFNLHLVRAVFTHEVLHERPADTPTLDSPRASRRFFPPSRSA